MTSIVNHGIHCVPSSKYPLCEEGDTSTINNNVLINGELTITPPIGFTGKTLTVNGDLDVTGIIDPIGMVFEEQANNPQAPTVSEGVLWLRNDAPTTLIFTNSVGTDIDLSSGASSSLTSAGGTTLVVDGTSPDFIIKGLTASGNSSITDNGTDLEVVTPVTTLANSGLAETLVVDGTGPTLTTKGLTGGGGITLFPGATDVVIATTLTFASGIYVPSPSALSNLSGYTSNPSFFFRIGSVVTVYFTGSAVYAAAGVSASVRLDLPIAFIGGSTQFNNNFDATGSFVCNDSDALSLAIQAIVAPTTQLIIVNMGTGTVAPGTDMRGSFSYNLNP